MVESATLRFRPSKGDVMVTGDLGRVGFAVDLSDEGLKACLSGDLDLTLLGGLALNLGEGLLLGDGFLLGEMLLRLLLLGEALLGERLLLPAN